MSIIRNIWKATNKCLRKFIFNFGFKGIIGFWKYKKRLKKGKIFPAFQFISLTDNCNLKCQGCWVTKAGKAKNMEIELVSKIINESKKHGSHFFGILGGEPLMYKDLMKIFKQNPSCYFQLFTNGTLLNSDIANQLKIAANVSPLISFEGNELVADQRRGGKEVYNRTIQAIETSVQAGLITGVAISVCKSNIEMALSDEFIYLLHSKGVVYLWYYIFRPSGENPCYNLALSLEEIVRLREFLVNGRTKYPIILIDAYWDAEGKPFCPAARGLSHHINPYGYIEPCPVIQYACENANSDNLSSLYENSNFLRNFRQEISLKTNGCILMEDLNWLNEFAQQNNAKDTSNRQNFQITSIKDTKVCSHGSCPIIPEKNWFYRIAKRNVFLGFGAYS